jgi:putative SOS response-associated peptidase YedK
MCGRFTITNKKEILEERFTAKFEADNYNPRYNAAPSQKLPVILNTDPKIIHMIEWGIKPAWLKQVSKRDSLINVRSETIKEKKTFKKDFEERRCLVLADGFYEWKKNGNGPKIPYRIVLKRNKLFAFAGLWEIFEDKPVFAIITTIPNSILEPIHNRMPVILDENDESDWINVDEPVSSLLKFLHPLPGKKMESYTVSTLVNSTKRDSVDLIEPFNSKLV